MKNSIKAISAAAAASLLMCSFAVCAEAKTDDNKVRLRIVNETYTADTAAWSDVLIDEWVPIDDSSTAVSVLLSALSEHDKTQTGAENGYITEIGGLSASDGGTMSGWMFMLDNWITDEAVTAYTVSSGKLESGDELTFAYSLDYGADLGYDWMGTDTSLSGIEISAGTLSPEFSSEVKEYTLDLPSDVSEVTVAPAAKNKAFRTKVYKNEYTPSDNGKDYKLTEKIEVADGDVIYIGTADPEWHTYIAEGAEKSLYTVTVNAAKAPAPVPSEDETEIPALRNGELTPKQIADEIGTEMLLSDSLTAGREWDVMTLARLESLTDEARTEYLDSLKEALSDTSALKITDAARITIALSALGEDASDFAGTDLTRFFADHDAISAEPVNTAVFALIALDARGYDIPEAPEGKAQTTRELLVEDILSAQLPDNGWTFWGDAYDPDMTAMALTALAPYAETEKAGSAVEKALALLSDAQNSDGSYSSFGAANAESCAQVAVALCSLGIDPTKDERFAKNGRTVIDALKEFYDTEGKGFSHVLPTEDGAEVNSYSTTQAFYALCAYLRFADGKTALYDMSDVTPAASEPEKNNGSSGNDNKDDGSSGENNNTPENGSSTPAQDTASDNNSGADNAQYSRDISTGDSSLAVIAGLFAALVFSAVLITFGARKRSR